MEYSLSYETHKYDPLENVELIFFKYNNIKKEYWPFTEATILAYDHLCKLFAPHGNKTFPETVSL